MTEASSSPTARQGVQRDRIQLLLNETSGAAEILSQDTGPLTLTERNGAILVLKQSGYRAWNGRGRRLAGVPGRYWVVEVTSERTRTSSSGETYAEIDADVLISFPLRS